MRTIVDHFYGSEDLVDLQLVRLSLILESSRESEALARGWALNGDRWYNSRSTRLRVDAHSSPKRVSGYAFEHVRRLTSEQLEQVKRVYGEFIAIKGFAELYELLPDDPRTSWILAARQEQDGSGSIRAFTMFTEYDGALESNLTAWDYSEPKKSLGKNLIGYEIDVARSMGYEYLYIGPGYNDSGVYKADLKGFEWWTGEEWSTDVNKYKKLCRRDSSITTLRDLSEIYTRPAEGDVAQSAPDAGQPEVQG